ncbi:amidase family protein [Candidatus Spongiihabitans sp.]|uniref:amidase family protein n=1 Tax=Candidatus Spongiihabitans sp. TaxID=3101308 RepID=UPI003C7AD9B1
MSKTSQSHFGLRQLAEQVQKKEISVASLVTRRLGKASQSESVFISLNHDIVGQAQAIDKLIDQAIQSGKPLSPLSGLPITLKDLFDVRGEITLAGSRVLKNIAKPAAQDCAVIAPLRNAGLLFLGRTNMSEFAFSGMGLNPHYGNPQSIWDRATGRLSGGSSSGSAVSVAEGIVAASMGSDTAGSCRIPAAFNGIVGVKPSYGRYSLAGVYPLSPTSDAPGPLAADLDSCFILDQVITGAYSGAGALPEAQRLERSNLSLLVPESVVLEDLDDRVKASFERALGWLEQAGAAIKHRPMPVIDRCIDMFFKRSIVGYEAWQHHQSLIQHYGDEYDPFVRQRLENSRQVTEREQQSRYREKAGLQRDFNRVMQQQQGDGLIYPTVACVPPTMAEAMAPPKMNGSAKINLRCLRNTAAANYFNGCSISLPCHRPGDAPVGLMVSLSHNQDDYLYRVAATVEKILNDRRVSRGCLPSNPVSALRY